MSERRTPYGPRKVWPGETAGPRFIPADLKAEISGAAFDELTQLRQRLAALEAAARAVVGAYEREDELLLLFREIEELGRVLGERN